MEWMAIAILVLVLALGVAVFGVLFQFLSLSRENHEHYRKIMTELGSIKDRLPDGGAKVAGVDAQQASTEQKEMTETE